MNNIQIPKTYNYIAVFLTLSCNLKCSYCINNFQKNCDKRKIISGKDWVKGLNRIISRKDLPISLQGGEPTLHPDFYFIVNNIKKNLKIDLLTNLQFDIYEFMKNIKPERIKRDALYASIRVSYHPEQMSLEETIEKVLKMQEKGYSIGVWGVLHPDYKQKIINAQKKCIKLGIDFRVKEFLGEHDGKLYGTYKYPGACSGKAIKKVYCRTSEFLIDSAGMVFRCHFDLYSNQCSIGNLLDPSFDINEEFLPCSYFGRCNPCDVKVKTNRFQQYGHTSVEIVDFKK